MDSNLINQIADQFVANLREDLSAETMAEIVRLNMTPAYAGCCASHDFCDANVYMLAAWESLTHREMDAASQEDADLWNAAWDQARRYQLVGVDSESELVAEFANWTYAQPQEGFREGDAMELLFHPELTAAQRDWLNDFIQRWDRMLEVQNMKAAA